MQNKELWFVVGLGNSQDEYSDTRHNVGFQTIDRLAGTRSDWFESPNRAQCLHKTKRMMLVKPMLGMNRSGVGINNTIAQEKAANTIVIYDDMDFEPGVVRVKVGGGAGGHNGVKSIINTIGKDFVRIRIGIGKPARSQTGTQFVLGGFRKKEKELIDEAIVVASEVVEHIVEYGVQSAMQKYNGK